MIYGDSLSSLSLASSHSGGISLFSLAHGMAVEVTCGSTGSSHGPNIRVYGECAVYRCVLVRIMVAYSSNTFHEGLGM